MQNAEHGNEREQARQDPRRSPHIKVTDNYAINAAPARQTIRRDQESRNHKEHHHGLVAVEHDRVEKPLRKELCQHALFERDAQRNVMQHDQQDRDAAQQVYAGVATEDGMGERVSAQLSEANA